jgi:tetratricopeptide (TPR) repeat protein
VLGRVGVGLGSAALVAAPLVVGGVHRIPMFLLLLTCGLALACVAFGASSQRPLRTSAAIALPLVLLVIPLLQSVPLPLGLRGLIDPAGNALLVENGVTVIRAWPLSLDPPLTREIVGKAAAVVAIFMIAYHWAAGQSKRHLVTRLIGATGVAATVIGLGHRILGFSEIYGLIRIYPRGLLTGPFVNANHTAEFLELAAFACLACALQRDNILNRYGWLTGMVMCAAGALGTLSRGVLVGLLTGTPLFLLLLRRSSRDDDAPQRRGAALALGAGVLALVAGLAALLGAGALVDRFNASSFVDEVRFRLWRDGLRVLSIHPGGIGRGAFNRLYPVYRTLKNEGPALTYAHLENHPLQLLVDSGWPLFLAIVAAVVVVVREIVRRGRRDRIEAALLAGLFAVTAHSFLDFGLETLGVALPFAAILGTVLGRCRSFEEAAFSKRATRAIFGLTCASLVFGLAAIAHSSDDDFDKLLKRSKSVEETRALLLRAQEVHPTDYFYAFAYAHTEPIKPRDGRSPRLHALNRALRLCPECDAQLHVEVARTLWSMKLRSQSLVEWRVTVKIQPTLLGPTMEELWGAGAKPAELAALASFDAAKMVEAADFLAGKGELANALSILDEADLVGAPRAESLLTRCRLLTQLGQLEAAATTLAEARATGIQDPRVAVLEANLILATKGAPGAGEALSILDLAAIRYPLDVPVQRLRASIVLTYGKWQTADRAIDGFKTALYRTAGQAIEANLVAARIRAKLGQWNVCFSEYRQALTLASAATWIWFEFGQTAESAGRDTTAREAYAEAARLAPSEAKIAEALRRVEARQGYLRSLAGPPPGR